MFRETVEKAKRFWRNSRLATNFVQRPKPILTRSETNQRLEALPEVTTNRSELERKISRNLYGH